MKALWKGIVIADSSETVVIEGNHYFPPDSIDKSLLLESSTHTTCPWKGVASYFSIKVDNEVNKDAVWFYPEPKSEALKIKNYFAFWKGVEIKE